MKPRLPSAVDVGFIGGLALLGYGLWQVFAPAAFMVPGALLIAVSVWSWAKGRA